MGQAESSNVAQAVSNVSNYVSQSTKANAAQANAIAQSINLSNCTIEVVGNFTATESSTVLQTNNQITSATQDTSLNNNIAQQMLQQATSKVGTLGLGYADASNSASQMVNDTNQIVDAMTTSASQYSATAESFNCDNSYISVGGNFDIDLSSSSNFLSSQTLSNSQTSDVVNDVSQSITQKATATVEGLADLLIALALIVAVIIWALLKPLSTGAAKVGVGIILSFAMAALVGWAYVDNLPPFFNSPGNCANGSSLGGCLSSCINPTEQTINLKNPPLRYSYGLTVGDKSITSPGNLPDGAINLVQIVIASVNKNPDNGGYTVDTYTNLQTIIAGYQALATSIGVTNIPNPLMVVKNSNGKASKIPIEYMTSAGGAKGSAAMCTPKILSAVVGAPGIVSDCPSSVDPANLDDSTDPTNGIANLNDLAWQNYLNSTSPVPSPVGPNDTPLDRALFARFVLVDMMGIVDLNVYIQPTELVRYGPDMSEVMQAQNVAPINANKVFQFIPSSQPSDAGYRNCITSGGTLNGIFGVCGDNTYKFQNFMKKIGGWIILGIVGIAFLYMFITWIKNRGSGNSETKH